MDAVAVLDYSPTTLLTDGKTACGAVQLDGVLETLRSTAWAFPGSHSNI
jgi:hypothetical protein